MIIASLSVSLVIRMKTFNRRLDYVILSQIYEIDKSGHWFIQLMWQTRIYLDTDNLAFVPYHSVKNSRQSGWCLFTKIYFHNKCTNDNIRPGWYLGQHLTSCLFIFCIHTLVVYFYSHVFRKLWVPHIAVSFCIFIKANLALFQNHFILLMFAIFVHQTG